MLLFTAMSRELSNRGWATSVRVIAADIPWNAAFFFFISLPYCLRSWHKAFADTVTGPERNSRYTLAGGMEVTVPSSCQQCCGGHLLWFVGYSYVFVENTLTLASGDDCTGIADGSARSGGANYTISKRVVDAIDEYRMPECLY